ncbi:MAG: hypothetical protein HRT90_10325 [Candidatus Margulisbacteria bacterium]|nr:hypothetical protein [Candidatus Margulisiibacteriota bacterium]
MINLRNRIGNVKLYTLCLMVALLLSGCGSTGGEEIKKEIKKELTNEVKDKIQDYIFTYISTPEEAVATVGGEITLSISGELIDTHVFEWKIETDGLNEVIEETTDQVREVVSPYIRKYTTAVPGTYDVKVTASLADKVVEVYTFKIRFDAIIPPLKPNIGITVYHQELIFEWTYPSDSGCDSLILYSSEEPFSDSAVGEIVYSGNALEYVDKGLTNGTTYYYKAEYNCTTETHTAAHEFSGIPADVEVVIPDPGLNNAISSEFQNLSDNTLNVSDVLTITQLFAGNINISNLEGIQHLRNLNTLALYDNNIEDLTPLEDLTQLNDLSLSQNKINDLTPLQYLTKLNTLNLSDNNIEDLTPLEDLTQLNFLLLGGNDIVNINPLRKLVLVATLGIEKNNITDISVLRDLIPLKELYISAESNEMLQSLSKLTLENLPNIVTIKIYGNETDWNSYDYNKANVFWSPDE